MDKETLSQYGWVVIVIIVLAIMIGLATPFGSFVKQSVDNTVHSFGDKIIVSLDDANVDTATNKPKLAVKEGTIGVIDTSRRDKYCDENGVGTGDKTFTGYIYGVEVEPGYEETIDTVFEVIGDGELEIIGTEAGSEVGTGTIVNVLDTNGDVIESYVLVIFGDVTGDGIVNVEDAIDIELHDNYAYEISSNGMRFEYAYQSFAGDVNCDGRLDSGDSGVIDLHDGLSYTEGSDGMRMYQSDVIKKLSN
jgi:hypothetical protein